MSIIALPTITSGATSFWSRFIPKAQAVPPPSRASRTAWKNPKLAASTLWIRTSAPCRNWAEAASLAAATSSQLPMNVSSTAASGSTAFTPASKAMNVPFALGISTPPTMPTVPVAVTAPAAMPAR